MSDLTIPTFQKIGTSNTYFVINVERENVITCSVDGIVERIPHAVHQNNRFGRMISDEEAITALDAYLNRGCNVGPDLYKYVTDYLDSMFDDWYGTTIKMVV